MHTAGNGKIITGENADMGLNDYLSSVDCMIMGRKCMDMISSMNLTPEQWFYGDMKIIVLSNTVKEAPDNLKDKVEMYSGDLNELISSLENEGLKQEIDLLMNESRSFQDPVDILQQEKCKIEAEMENLALREEDIKERKSKLDKK